MTAARQFDCVIVGAGIVGLAHALAAARAGLRTCVIERDEEAVGASIRNFGFVTVTGQQAGLSWRRARRSRDVWAELAGPVGVEIVHRGLYVCARREEALDVLAEFCATEMGSGCELLDAGKLAGLGRGAIRDDLAGGLFSPHELRVESRTAIPRLQAWLAAHEGVTFKMRTAVRSVETGHVETTDGAIEAAYVVVCPGPDLVTLFKDTMAQAEVTLCKLHMLRVAPPPWRLPGAIMSDLGLVRYLGYAGSPSLPRLRARLQAERPRALANGVHLIVVQSADGSLVVGDSHHYGLSHSPFQPESVDALILDELKAVSPIEPRVVDRWLGYYPSGASPAIRETPLKDVKLVNVTSGTGASTAFAIAEETIAELLGRAPPAHVDGEP